MTDKNDNQGEKSPEQIVSDAALADLFPEAAPLVVTPPIETPPVEGETPPVVPPVAPPVEEPIVESPPIAASEEDEPVIDPAKQLEEDNIELRKQLNEMARTGLLSPTAPAPVPAAAAPAPTPAAPVAPAVPTNVFELLMSPEVIKEFNDKMGTEEEYLSKEELDRLIDNPSVIQGGLNKMGRKTAEKLLNVLPVVVDHIVVKRVEQIMNAQRAADEFFEINKDLAPYRDFTKVTFEKLHKLDKTKTVDVLFVETAKEARKALRLPDPTASPARQRGQRQPGSEKPGFAGVKTGTRAPRQEHVKEKTQQEHMADIPELR